ncbi:hypothetical protein GBAR_LOCUS11255 [Geodia barretti]|uniref:Uncharacterized protein n=1 Tax=Geodia barretti TaxID=519541 RepID=A0AA35RVP6_GEOBA|nr:hypothetical protein GBAR_LOCUS11255 [Geodia barretti]
MSDPQTCQSDEDKQTVSVNEGEQQQLTAALPVSLGDSPPRGSALLLCPAQWNALLEAAPVSLVVREMSDGTTVAEDPEQPDFGAEAESESEDKEGEKIPRLVFAEDDEIRTPLGGQTPDPDRTYSVTKDTRHYCSTSETLENVALELDNPSSLRPPLLPSRPDNVEHPIHSSTTSGTVLIIFGTVEECLYN